MSAAQETRLPPPAVDKLHDILAQTTAKQASSVAAVQDTIELRHEMHAAWERVNSRRRRSPAFDDLTADQVEALTPKQLEALNIQAEDFHAWRTARRRLARARLQLEEDGPRVRAAITLSNNLREYAKRHGVNVNEF